MQTSSSKLGFSGAIYLATLRRYWAGGALLTIILSLTALAFHYSYGYVSGLNATAEVRLLQKYYSAAVNLENPTALIFIVIASVICAALVFSFIHNKRGVVMMHSLPVRRDELFVSTFLGGLTLVWVPTLLYALFTALSQLSARVFVASSVFLWLMMTLLFSLLAFSLVAFAVQLTGSRFAVFTVAGLIIGLPVLLELFITMQFQQHLYGYVGNGFNSFNMAANPFIFMWFVLVNADRWITANPGEILIPTGDIIRICAIFAICILLIAVSLLLYKRRKLEMAGEFIAVKGMRPVFRYGGAFLGAFFLMQISNGLDFGVPILFGLIGGTIGFIVAEMLIRKTVKVWRNLKGAALFAGCFLALIFLISIDIMGYETYSPPADKVESVRLGGSAASQWPNSQDRWSFGPIPYLFTEKADIDAALEFHQELVTVRPPSVSSSYSRGHYYGDVFYENWLEPNERNESYWLEATLKNGRTVTRRYSVSIDRSSRLGILADAIDNAANRQSVELLRNVGMEAKSISLGWNGPTMLGKEQLEYGWSEEDLKRYNEDRLRDYERYPSLSTGETLIRYEVPKSDVSGFIGALIRDNQDDPRWHIGWGWNVERQRIISGSVPQERAGQSASRRYSRYGYYNDRYYGNYDYSPGLDIYVFDQDRNTINWLRDNGYLGVPHILGIPQEY